MLYIERNKFFEKLFFFMGVIGKYKVGTAAVEQFVDKAPKYTYIYCGKLDLTEHC